MHQPIREYRGITGGFILLANTITIRKKRKKKMREQSQRNFLNDSYSL